jgi:hypothetical protein
MNVTRLAFCGVVGLGLGACVDSADSAALRILGNVAPGDGCSVDSASTTFLDDGIIEANDRFGYVFTPSARNDLQTIGDELTGPKTIYVTHARVLLNFYDPDLQGAFDDSLVNFSVATSGAIEPNGGTAAFSFEIVPPELLTLIGDRLGDPTDENPRPRTVIDAKVQLVGSRGGGGGEEESNAFRYPVEVCVGCLAIDLGPCENLDSSFMPQTGGVCNAAQDGVLECCDNFTTCPAAPQPTAP